jgi:predicted DNA-binding transcriptional regulator AlpA
MAARAPCEVPAGLLDVALIDVRQVCVACGLSVSKWQELVRVGAAPQPAVRAPRYTRWRLTDVRDWLRLRSERGHDDQAARVVDKARRASAAARVSRSGAQPVARGKQGEA